MKKYLIFYLFMILNLTNYSQSCKVEIKIISSENGYTLIPDVIRIADFNNAGKFINVPDTYNNYYSATLPAGTYLLSAGKEGYTSCETYFSVEGKDVKYDIYLDPINKDPLLNPERIRNLLKDNSALLLGYVVDDETGEPLNSVVLKNDKNNITSLTNVNGFFELGLPSACDLRSFVNLSFHKMGYITEKFDQFELLPKTDFIFTVRLKKSTYYQTSSLPAPGLWQEGYHPSASLMAPGVADLTGGNKKPESECEGCRNLINTLYSGFVLPINIRVGRNCSGTNCTYAEVYSLETYCKYVLPAEVYACWGNISGGMNSLQACAVAVRSYGVYYVYNPINPSLYDICDNTYCQYMGSVTSTNTSNAVDNTYRNILTNSAGVVRCEYSAENNNKGCGNGYSGTGSSWPCIYDPVCMNAAPNGHGRGLCQWGTVRWATGTLVTTSSPCSPGAPHSFGSKTWLEILDHYYNVSPYNWSVVLGTTAAINTSSCVPSASNPCSTFTITSNISATNSVNLMIGASIAPAGTTNWISDPAHDIMLEFAQGTGNYNRSFTIPCSVQPGIYDLLTALWFDKDNNNQINLGDFVVYSKLTPNALTISPTGIKVVSVEIPNYFKLEQNFPNPFNPSTKIKFDISKLSNVELIVFDVLGKQVSKLVYEELKQGKYSVEWDASSFPSGVYFCKIRAADFTDTKRMIIVK